MCIKTPTVVGDGIDNDCDGLIDEEMCTVENKRKGKKIQFTRLLSKYVKLK